MNLLALLDLLADQAGTKLKELLEAQLAERPDLEPALRPVLTALETGVTAENIAAFVAVLPAEVADMLKLHFHPKPHAGDSI